MMGSKLARAALPIAAIAVGVVALAASLFGRGSRGCKPLVQGQGLRVLLVGDSLAVGLAKPFSAEAASRGHDAHVAAKISTTMRYWLGSGGLARIVDDLRPDLVVVVLGTNDSRTTYTDEQLAQDVSGILSVAGSRGARVVWVLPPRLPFRDRVSPIVRATRTPAFESAAQDIPQVDGIHPTGSGSQAWSSQVWSWLTCEKNGSSG